MPDAPPACPDHGATVRNDGTCMVRGCRYGQRVTSSGPTDEQVAEVRALMDADPEVQAAVEALHKTRDLPPAEGRA